MHNLEKMEKNYEDINITVSFSVLRCFRSTGYLLLIIAHERMYLLSISTKEGGTQNKTHVPSRVLLYIFLVILFSFCMTLASDDVSLHQVWLQKGSVFRRYLLEKAQTHGRWTQQFQCNKVCPLSIDTVNHNYCQNTIIICLLCVCTRSGY